VNHEESFNSHDVTSRASAWNPWAHRTWSWRVTRSVHEAGGDSENSSDLPLPDSTSLSLLPVSGPDCEDLDRRIAATSRTTPPV